SGPTRAIIGARRRQAVEQEDVGSGRCPALDANSDECPLSSSSSPPGSSLPVAPRTVPRRRPPSVEVDEPMVVRGPRQTETSKEGRMIKAVLTGAILLLVAVVVLQSLPDFQRYVQLRDM